MKYKPFFYKKKYFGALSLGLDRIFTVTLYKNGLTISICHFGTILKKYDLEIELLPFSYSKRIY